MSIVHSPLFEPVIWQDRGFKILNEISIPERVEYIHVMEVSHALAAVREMKTRAFGQVLTFLYAGALLAQDYSGKEAQPLRQALAHARKNLEPLGKKRSSTFLLPSFYATDT